MGLGDTGSGQGSATAVTVVVYLVGVAGITAALTVLFYSMRAVMDIGGYCAEGGPYEISQHCPNGVGELTLLSILGLFVFGGLMVYQGIRLGSPFDGLIVLAWPALFISLGWNFLEYALRATPGTIELGWLIPGVLFVLMGSGPLYLAVTSRGSRGLVVPNRLRSSSFPGIRFGPTVSSASASDSAEMDDPELRELAELEKEGASSPTGADAAGDLASGLERLAKLHAAGDLDEAEYDAAKRALIHDAASR